jgi:hypothetical protein
MDPFTLALGTLWITVYDRANLPLANLRDELRPIFQQAGIEIVWVTGETGVVEGSTVNYSAWPSKERVKEISCRARRNIALSIVKAPPPGASPSMLAISHPLAETGLNVRVFADGVRDSAEARNVRLERLLAHVVAHEIGHVLMRSGGHDSHGLMAAVWGAREYEWMAGDALRFTAEQSRTMRATLAGAGCVQSTAR